MSQRKKKHSEKFVRNFIFPAENFAPERAVFKFFQILLLFIFSLRGVLCKGLILTIFLTWIVLFNIIFFLDELSGAKVFMNSECVCYE